MAEGIQEKIQTHRRGKAPLLGRMRRGVGHHRKLPALEHAHACMLRGWGCSVEATGGKKPLAHLGETGRFLCRLPVARHLLCGLRAPGG